MKTGPASFIAMVAGWALPLAGLALVQLARSGRTADIAASAFWVGLFAPKGTPENVVTYLRQVLNTAAHSEQFKSALANLGQELDYMDMPEFAAFWAALDQAGVLLAGDMDVAAGVALSRVTRVSAVGMVGVDAPS